MYVPVSDPMSMRVLVHDEADASRDRAAAAFSSGMRFFIFIAYCFVRLGGRYGECRPRLNVLKSFVASGFIVPADSAGTITLGRD